MSNTEQTLSIIKPDAVERNLDNEIKEMFKNKGFSIVNEKKIQIEKSEAEKFYKVHETKPFYNDLCAYLSSGPIVVMVLEKENAVLGNRELMGATNPEQAEEGTIRKKYGISIDKNSVHGSDSLENAKIEEVKDSEYVIVLDSPEIPIRRSKPNKFLAVILSGFLGIGFPFITPGSAFVLSVSAAFIPCCCAGDGSCAPPVGILSNTFFAGFAVGTVGSKTVSTPVPDNIAAACCRVNLLPSAPP